MEKGDDTKHHLIICTSAIGYGLLAIVRVSMTFGAPSYYIFINQKHKNYFSHHSMKANDWKTL